MGGGARRGREPPGVSARWVHRKGKGTNKNRYKRDSAAHSVPQRS